MCFTPPNATGAPTLLMSDSKTTKSEAQSECAPRTVMRGVHHDASSATSPWDVHPLYLSSFFHLPINKPHFDQLLDSFPTSFSYDLKLQKQSQTL